MVNFRFTQLTITGGPTGTPDFHDITYSPELGVFVAVGSMGDDADKAMRSVDGINWTFHTLPVAASWTGVVWAAGLNLFVACNMNNTLSKIATSPDGITWSNAFAPTPSNEWASRCIEWSEDLGILVCGSNAGAATPTATTRFMYSSDGTNWTKVTGTPNRGIEAISWSPELSLFVAAAGNPNLDTMLSSPDGLTWTLRDMPDTDSTIHLSRGSHTLLTWADDLGIFVCVREDGSVMKSSDGFVWSLMTLSADPLAGLITGVAWAKRLGLLVFVGDADGTVKPIQTSEDGVNIDVVEWVAPAFFQWYLPVYSDTLDRMPIIRRLGYFELLVEFGPEITAVIPDNGDVAGGNTVEVTGNGFIDGDIEVVFGNKFATDLVVNSLTSINCTVPNHIEAGPELVDVTVTSPSDGRFDVGANLYEYTEVEAPSIETAGTPCAPGSISPSSGTFIGGTLVTINGTGFTPGMLIYFGDDLADDITYVSPTQYTCHTPAHQTGSVDVTIREP